VEHEEQLSWERRVGRPVAIAAFLAAAFLVASIVYQSSTIKGSTSDTVDQLFVLHKHRADFLIGSIMQALSTALFAPPLWFLYKVVKYRRPELPSIAKWLALVGPPASAVLFVISRIQVADVADKVFAELATNPRTPDAANTFAKDMLKDGNLQLVGGLGFAGGLAMALALVLICINAMRSGVLSRFMAIVGIIVGVLLVLPIFGNVPFVQVFWVAALGMLFLGRWPQGGRGPAWDSGEPIPWPTAADRQAAIAEARAEREAGRGDDREPEPEPVAVGEPDDASDGAQPARRTPPSEHPRSKKRKRKRRG
jgi:hypothetical protein